MSRPIEGKETKVNKSVKIEPWQYKLIIKEYGSFTAWVNLKFKNDRKLKKG